MGAAGLAKCQGPRNKFQDFRGAHPSGGIRTVDLGVYAVASSRVLLFESLQQHENHDRAEEAAAEEQEKQRPAERGERKQRGGHGKGGDIRTGRVQALRNRFPGGGSTESRTSGPLRSVRVR